MCVLAGETKGAGMTKKFTIKWTTTDIRLLRKYYLQQQSLKMMMSRLLGRTPTAINKCLTRFRIRPVKKTSFFPLPKKTIKDYGQTPTITQAELEHSVLFYAKTVLHMDIELITEGRYRVGREVMTFPQILLRVNTDRVQRNLAPLAQS